MRVLATMAAAMVVVAVIAAIIEGEQLADTLAIVSVALAVLGLADIVSERKER